MTEVTAQDIQNAHLFRDFAPDVLEALAQRSKRMELPAGHNLFHQDDPGDALYILLDGQVHVIRRHAAGDEVILATEGPYYAIGELSMLAGQRRTGTVQAVSDCTLVMVSTAAFEEVCSQFPEVAVRTLAYLAQRLYRLNLLVREQALGNVTARIASALLLLAAGQEGGRFAVRLTRLARAVALDADAVERILREWDAAGWIALDSRAVTLRDSKAIEDIAG